jgi:hypothetical protein
MKRTSTFTAVLLTLSLSSCSVPVAERAPLPDRRSHFIGFTDLSAFTQAAGSEPDTRVFTSKEIAAPIDWNELVISWNAPPDTALKVEARALGHDGSSRFYHLGLWSLDPARHPRTSVTGQKDSDGEVKTDTLVLNRLARGAQVRLTLTPLNRQARPSLKFLGLSFLNSTLPSPSRSPNKKAWGKTIPVPEKGQLDYANGRDWCSPTSVSMVLAHWAAARHRRDWNVDVPEAARHIHDPAWRGTGNWCFNTAFAGSLPGIRAYVTRFSDLAEVETWTAAGFPVVLSVSFDLLNGKTQDEGTGHLVVCAGFTDTGDVVVNDPWAPKKDGLRVRRTYPRAQVVQAWQRSDNTVYLIYPAEAKIPPNRWGHW